MTTTTVLEIPTPIETLDGALTCCISEVDGYPEGCPERATLECGRCGYLTCAEHQTEFQRCSEAPEYDHEWRPYTPPGEPVAGAGPGLEWTHDTADGIYRAWDDVGKWEVHAESPAKDGQRTWALLRWRYNYLATFPPGEALTAPPEDIRPGFATSLLAAMAAHEARCYNQE